MVFGTKGKVINSQVQPNLICPHCNTQGKIKTSVVAKYFHLTFIPTFPTGKSGFSQCDHCKQTLEENQMPPAFRNAINELKNNSSAPKWMFSGVFLILGLGMLMSIFDKKNHAEDANFISAPVAGDKYHMKLGYREYTIYRVNKVTADSLYLDFNNYSVNKATGYHRIDKEENYSPGGAISNADAQKLFDEGKIENIIRD